MNPSQFTRLVLLSAISLSSIALGCGSSAEPTYFALSAANQPRLTSAQATWAHVIKLRRPAIAGYLDRAEIVSGVADHRLRVASGESWGEPLGDMIGRVLAEDLSARLGSVVFTEASPISANPDAVVSVDIQRFDADDTHTVTLLGQIAVERTSDHASLATRNVALRLPAPPGTASLVAAMSQLVSQLADQVAPYLVDAPHEPTG